MDITVQSISEFNDKSKDRTYWILLQTLNYLGCSELQSCVNDSLQLLQQAGFALRVVEVVVLSTFSHYYAVPALGIDVDIADVCCPFLVGQQA